MLADPVTQMLFVFKRLAEHWPCAVSIIIMYFIEYDVVQPTKLLLSQIVVLLGEILPDFIQGTSRFYWARTPLAEAIVHTT